MNWDSRLIHDHDLKPYLDGAASPRLNALASALVRHQRQTWPLLAEGYDALAAMETRRVQVGESSVVIQHNPKRIRSTAAAVDRASVGARQCFLCAANLPIEEKGIPYGPLVLLCNPYPILESHLSIVHREHVPQQLVGNIEMMLGLAYDLAPDFFVLYNGPECGASAPDHLHFQACSRAELPILTEALDDETPAHCGACEATARQGFELFTLPGCGRTVIVLRGDNSSELVGWVERLMKELGRMTRKDEAMVNIIATHDRGVWTLFMFPRAKHRPARFFDEGEQRLIVSPGAIDMGGVIVTPERRDFLKLDGELAAQIFSEVSFDEEIVNEILEQMSSVEGAW